VISDAGISHRLLQFYWGMLMLFHSKKSDFVAFPSQEGVSVALLNFQSLCLRLSAFVAEDLGSFDVSRRAGRRAEHTAFA
jgi:hypothetical protein